MLEIASNDGYLLRFFAQRGISVLGVEPARNVAEAAQEAGISTRQEFFGLGELELGECQGRLKLLAHVMTAEVAPQVTQQILTRESATVRTLALGLLAQLDGRAVRWVLPRTIGQVEITEDVPREVVQSVLGELGARYKS